MVLLSITSSTWIVTGLGFGIVLVLLFCLVYILQLFGWIMQKIDKAQKDKNEHPQGGEKAAVAMAMYLFKEMNHDKPASVINSQSRSTVWNDKALGLNNVGF
ncbi:MAG: OadG family protein [Paludibacteraceae bacterium]|nr:OadG family protein [Paludibacteraceae bacterium]